jgi:hypothetical protein
MKTLSFGILTHRAWSRAAVAAIVILTAGCAWQDFDTVEETTWATSIDQPGAVGDSDTWATAVEPAGLNSFAVFGSGKASVVVMSLNDKGELNKIESASKVYKDFGSIAVHSSAPDGASFAFIDSSNQVQIWDGARFSEPIAGDSSVQTMGFGQILGAPRAILASKSTVTGAVVERVTIAPPVATCSLPQSGVLAMAITNTDVVTIWQSDGRLVNYAIASTNVPCAPTEIASGLSTTGTGRVLTTGNGGRVYVATFASPIAPGKIIAVDPVANSPKVERVIDGLQSIGLIRVSPTENLIAAGSPNVVQKGVNNAGQVVFLDGMTLADSQNPVVLHDAQPTEGQNFGQGVVGVQINVQNGVGKPVVIVAAKDEIFAYFKTAAFAESRAK